MLITNTYCDFGQPILIYFILIYLIQIKKMYY